MYPDRHRGNTRQGVAPHAPGPRHLTVDDTLAVWFQVGSWWDLGEGESWAGWHCSHLEPWGSQVHFLLAQMQLNLLPTKKQALWHRSGARPIKLWERDSPMAAPRPLSTLQRNGHCLSENRSCSMTPREHTVCWPQACSRGVGVLNSSLASALPSHVTLGKSVSSPSLIFSAAL